MPSRIIKPHKIIEPFQKFFQHEASSGILLLICAAFAMVVANSPLTAEYERLLHTHLTIGYGRLALSNSLLHWINDGLMAVFFFVVGMEIKRELVLGELKSIKKAALPIGAAAGGMIVPALLYTLFNAGTPAITGWGIPMATDIAFALGALSILGSARAPKGLAVFLTALAIVDDLGAILVIALFYTEQVSWLPLIAALGLILALILANKTKINSVTLFLALGILLWLALQQSGIHATIAGVLLGMTIPSRTTQGRFSMLHRLEHQLQPWVVFGIMPLFALANAGVVVEFNRIGEVIANPVSIGIITGLFLGKQIGIFGASFLMIRFKIAKLPSRVTLKQIYGASLLGGIGFTMSLFIATLAFPGNGMLAVAKISIIIASSISAIAGILFLSKQKSRDNVNKKSPQNFPV